MPFVTRPSGCDTRLLDQDIAEAPGEVPDEAIGDRTQQAKG